MKVGVVLDTNAWLDWLVFGDPTTRVFEVHHLDGQCHWLASAHTRAEFAEVLGRDTFDRPLARISNDLQQARAAVRAAFDARARICAEPPACGLFPTDADDQVFIDLAVAQRASWLLTRDRALLRLRRRALKSYGVTVVPPSAFSIARVGS